MKTLTRVQDNSYVTPFDDPTPNENRRKSGRAGLSMHDNSVIRLEVSQTRDEVIDQLTQLWSLKQQEKE